MGLFALTFLCNLGLTHEVKQQAAASFPFTRFLSALASHLAFLTALPQRLAPLQSPARPGRAEPGRKRAGPGRPRSVSGAQAAPWRRPPNASALPQGPRLGPWVGSSRRARLLHDEYKKYIYI